LFVLGILTMAAIGSMSMQRQSNIAALLSFAAGYVDTVGFIALLGLFTAHVTGNLVLIGASLVSVHSGVAAKLAALPVFILVVAIATGFVRTCERAGRQALRPLLVMQMILLGAFAVAGTAAEPIADADAPLAVLAGLLGVASMSIQNAASRLLMHELPPTTVMTGGVTELAIDLTQLLLGAGADRAVLLQRLAKFLLPVLTFAVGAIVGALLYANTGFVALLLPITALAAAAMLAYEAPQAREIHP
jgi:uncharacterized membrane protein YoaK (UPF0700 family)